MNTIILTGSPWSGVENLFNHLAACGLGASRDVENGNHSNSIRDWHDRVFSNQQFLTHQQISLGKAWEQSAGELFLANWQQSAWGWADVRTTWLLDFWRDFDPHTHFILISIAPELALAQAIAQVDNPSAFSVDDVMDTWLAYERQLLRFYLRNQTRCLLVDFEQIDANLPGLIETVNDKWQLTLETNMTSVATKTQTLLGLPLAKLLASETLQHYPEALSLQQEISASVSLLPGVTEQSPCQQAAEVHDAIIDLRAFIHTNNQQFEQLTQARDEHAELARQRQGELDKRTAELNAKLQTVDTLTEENELLLLQLHQVQEELEQYFLKTQTLESEQQRLTQARDEQAALAKQSQAQAQQLTAERDQANQLATERQQQLEQLTKARDEQAQLARQRQGELDKRTAELNAKLQTVDTLTEENELLLLQLHQVQEELEHYFLKHQQEQRSREQIEQRLGRLLQHWPDFVDMEDLQIESIGDAKTPELLLTATGVYHAERAVDRYGFRVRFDNKMPAILIDHNENPLLRWPIELTEKESIIIPAKPMPGILGSSVLASSDWHLLQALAQTCAQSLKNGNFRLGADQNHTLPEFWPTLLERLAQALKADSHALRYDTVKLKQAKCNPDYEYLWLQFTNLTFNGKQWPDADVRLSAAAVKRSGFSIHPKLEFPQPEHGVPLFENWYPDIEDQEGQRMEFRFEINTKALDIAFWNNLTSADKALALALIWQLPMLLADLETQQFSLSRPWEDWRQLAQGMIETVKARVVELGIASSV